MGNSWGSCRGDWVETHLQACGERERERYLLLGKRKLPTRGKGLVSLGLGRHVDTSASSHLVHTWRSAKDLAAFQAADLGGLHRKSLQQFGFSSQRYCGLSDSGMKPESLPPTVKELNLSCYNSETMLSWLFSGWLFRLNFWGLYGHYTNAAKLSILHIHIMAT